MITRKDVEFAGHYGRAIVRRRDGFYELYWKGSEYVCAKLYPSYKLGSEDEAVADALRCVSRNRPPPAGSRSLRRATARGLAPVSVVDELRAVEQSPTWWPLTKPVEAV